MKKIKVPWEDFSSHFNLSLEEKNFIELAKELAQRKKYFLYIAGGPVRDFLLKKTSHDLDLVIEGSWEDLLPSLLEKTLAKVLFKSPFLTYKVKLREGLTIDLVTARKEIYPYPASLPLVQRATFKEDIERRDFTINALLYGLTPPFEEKILDLTRGLEDLSKGLLIPIHLNSFIEDPTRLLRGVRYKVRFTLKFSEEFYYALERAKSLKTLALLSPSRLAKEIQNFFRKERREDLPFLIQVSKDLDLFELSLLKKRDIKERDFWILSLAEKELAKKDFEKFCLLFLVELEERTLKRLSFSEKEILRILKDYATFKKGFILKEDLLERVEYLERLPFYFLLRMALEEEYTCMILQFLEKQRFVKPSLKGENLKEMGIKEEKEIGKILREIRRKKLLGELKNREEEKAFVESQFASCFFKGLS